MTDQNEGVPARAAALDLLHAALARRAGLDDALSQPSFGGLGPRERGHARALVMATLRNLGPIDKALAAKLQRPPPEMVTNLLRIGAAELYYLAAPDFAVVSTSVDLAAARKETRAFKGLVNAVLRALAREGAPAADPAALCPDWLLSRWKAAWGVQAALKIAAQIAEEPGTDLSFKAPPPAELTEALEAHALPGGSWRTAKGGLVSEWPGFEDGSWWIQDAAAAIPVRLLGVQPGESAVDLCAAPGGKTLQLAAAGAETVAVDRSAPRLKRVAENLARTGLSAETVAADAGTWDDARTFDAVLLDAPLHRHGHLPPPSRRAVGQPPRRRGAPGQEPGQAARFRRRPGEERRAHGLLRLLPGAGRGRAAGRGLPQAPSRLRPGAHRPRRGRRTGRQRHARGDPAPAALPHRRRRRRLLRGPVPARLALSLEGRGLGEGECRTFPWGLWRRSASGAPSSTPQRDHPHPCPSPLEGEGTPATAGVLAPVTSPR